LLKLLSFYGVVDQDNDKMVDGEMVDHKMVDGGKLSQLKSVYQNWDWRVRPFSHDMIIYGIGGERW